MPVADPTSNVYVFYFVHFGQYIITVCEVVQCRSSFSLAVNRCKLFCSTACLNLYYMSTTASVFATLLYDYVKIFCIITRFLYFP